MPSEEDAVFLELSKPKECNLQGAQEEFYKFPISWTTNSNLKILEKKHNFPRTPCIFSGLFFHQTFHICLVFYDFLWIKTKLKMKGSKFKSWNIMGWYFFQHFFARKIFCILFCLLFPFLVFSFSSFTSVVLSRAKNSPCKKFCYILLLKKMKTYAIW